MVDKIKIGGRDINAIIIEAPIDPSEYRNSLFNTLKVAVLNSQCELNGPDIWNVLDIIQATLPDEKGGAV